MHLMPVNEIVIMHTLQVMPRGICRAKLEYCLSNHDLGKHEEMACRIPSGGMQLGGIACSEGLWPQSGICLPCRLRC